MEFSKSDLPAGLNELSKRILDAAYQVHRAIGPGVHESVYEECLSREFRKRNLNFARQKAIPLHYDGETMETAFRADFIVEGSVRVELKAVERLLPLHKTQVKPI
jgi:GxxExxY protein